jgi:hypothetical protein
MLNMRCCHSIGEYPISYQIPCTDRAFRRIDKGSLYSPQLPTRVVTGKVAQECFRSLPHIAIERFKLGALGSRRRILGALYLLESDDLVICQSPALRG